MFSSPTPAPGSRTLASKALRKAGLIDQDAQMRDATDKPGGRKGSSRIRSHRPRAIDAYKDSGHLERLRRNAVSTSTSLIPVRTPTRSKIIGGVEVWRRVVQKRWKPDQRLLDLSSLIDDELVKTNKLQPPGYGGGAREAAVIFKLAKELKPENLSLHNNNIRKYLDLDTLAGKKDKLLVLRELILTGNHLREEEVGKGKEEHFTREVEKRYVSLSVLNVKRISAISLDVPQPSTSSAPPEKPSSLTFPLQMGGSLIVGVDPALITTFMMR
ncbi:hypothetical protein MPER_09329, partial [Moniliophthora perniciosa FA553]